MLAAAAVLLLALAVPALVSAQDADGVCHPGLAVGPGERCTYPGATAEFSVDSSGRGHFLSFTSSSSIELSGATIDGVAYDFSASAQGDGMWLVETAGDPGAPTSPTATAPGEGLDTAGGEALQGRILARRLSSGSVEFGFRPEGGELFLPHRRFFPASAREDHWLVSSAVEPDGDVLGQITARLRADGRIEFGFNPVEGERILARARFFPTTARVDRWLPSSIIDVPLPAAEPESAPAPGQTPAEADGDAGTDREALVALYHATGGPNWRNDANWLSDEPLRRWYGVTTDSGGRVVRLELSSNDLSGELPAELGQLSELQWLRMSYNQLSGVIPAELGRLGSLVTLRLTRSQLSGEIPAALGQLANLEGLYLNFNDLSGAIPVELGQLSDLVEMDLSWNELSGTIPGALGQLSGLEELDLSDNGLSGAIPAELAQLHSLEELDLSDNDLSGAIPPALDRLSNLVRLHLSDNDLGGAIPPALARLTNLVDLRLSGNELSGDIPAALGQLSKLELLYLSRNELSGSIPPALGRLSSLRELYLASNALSGCVPESLRNVEWNDFSRLGLPFCGALPDLVVDAPAVSESAPAAGARFTLRTTVRNLGTGRSDSTRLRYYRSADPAITAADTELGNDFVLRLEAAASGAESITLTAPSTAGTHYYGACVEAVPGESDTTNNCSVAVAITVAGPPAPDLVVDAPTVSNSAPEAGARFTLRATVRNQGKGRSDSTTLRYYRSVDPTITTADAELADDFVSRLRASASGAESVILTAPSTAGTYYLGACVEAVPGESDATNNCSAAVAITVGAAPAPDLVVDAPTVSERAPAAGARFRLNATVRNQGTGRSDSTTLRYYRSTDAVISTGDTELADDYVFRLGAAASGDEWVTLTAPSTAGTYYYGACVDAVSDETDTTNNCSAAVAITVGAAPAPDLVVDMPTVSESAPAAGVRFTLRATVRNAGTARSNSTTLRYFRSADAVVTTGDTAAGTDLVSALAASGSGTESISVTAPSTAGTYYYGACVDAVSDEQDTTNNCSAAVAITVGTLATFPDPPTGVTATANGQTRIDLSWTPPADDGGAAISGYRVEVSTDNLSWSDLSADTGSTTTAYSHRGLTAGSTRYYRVSAINSVGTSLTSTTASATTTAALPTFPDPPTGLSGIPNGQARIDLSWTAPADDGGAAISGYRVEVSADNSSWSDLSADTGSTTTSYSHTGLTAGSTRHYRVSAINSAGTSLTSTTASATTTAAPPTFPDPPTGLAATANGQTRIDLSWTAPVDNGGAAISGYRVEVSTDNSSWSDLSADTGSTTTSYSHTGLTAGSTRYYRVSAINSVGTGLASSAASATTAEEAVSDGTCSVGLVVEPGGSCTYPGTSTEFSVDADGTGRFLFTSSGTRLVLRDTTINGVSYTFVASKQQDGSWRVEEVD